MTKIVEVCSGGRGPVTVLHSIYDGPGFSLYPKEITVSAPQAPQQPGRPATPPPQQPQQPAPAQPGQPAPQAPPAPTPAAPRQEQCTADPWAAEVQ